MDYLSNFNYLLPGWVSSVHLCFIFFFLLFTQHCFIMHCPSDSTVSKDAGIKSRLWLWHWQPDSLTTQLDLIHAILDVNLLAIYLWLPKNDDKKPFFSSLSIYLHSMPSIYLWEKSTYFPRCKIVMAIQSQTWCWEMKKEKWYRNVKSRNKSCLADLLYASEKHSEGIVWRHLW